MQDEIELQITGGAAIAGDLENLYTDEGGTEFVAGIGFIRRGGDGSFTEGVTLFYPAFPALDPAYFSTAEYTNNSGLALIGMREAHARSYRGQGVTIGFVGAGFQTQHSQLAANVVTGWRRTLSPVACKWVTAPNPKIA